MPIAGYSAKEIADLIPGSERNGKGYRAPCPAHHGENKNLSILDSPDGAVLTCFSNGCEITDFVSVLNLEDRRPKKQTRDGGVTSIYSYPDASGNLSYQSMITRFPGGDKKSKMRRPDPANPGEFIYNMKGIDTVPYNFPEVLKAVASGETVFQVEGEKCVDVVKKLGLVGTTNTYGAGKGKFKKSHAEYFRGAHVVVIPDNDKPGKEHANNIVKLLVGVAASVKLVEIPGLAEKGDIYDWIEDGGTREQLDALIADAKPIEYKEVRRPSADKKKDTIDVLPWSDYTNAVALVTEHGDDFRYCYPWKRFMVWTGTHWQYDDSGVVHRMAKATIKRLARQLEHVSDEDAFLKHIKNSLRNASLKAMIECAQSEEGIPIMPEDFDADPWLLNCANGTIDLRTGDMRTHNRDDLITHCLSIPYDPNAACPTWDNFLWRIMGGTVEPDSPDDSANILEARQAADVRARELIDYLEDVTGYSLTGDTSEECFFILYGTGQNGKSKFVGALQDTLETYAQSTHSKTFMVTDRSDAIPNDIARLRGARLVVASELGKDRRLNEELVKRATGRDPMTARFLHAEFFDFMPQFKLFMATNYLPKITSVDKSMWRRIHQIPFTVTIPDEEKDPHLGDKLRAELPGILAWAVRGCLRWQAKGLNPPKAVLEATETYKSDMDVIGRFIDECCLVGSSYQVKGGDIYKAYNTWCDDNNERAETQTLFGRYLGERGFELHRSNGSWRLGIGLINAKTSENTDSAPK